MNPKRKYTRLIPSHKIMVYSMVIECFLTMSDNTAENIANHLGITRAMTDYYITKYLNNKFKNLKL